MRVCSIISIGVISGTQLVDELGFANTSQTLFNAPTFFRLIPEEVLALGQFLLLALGTLDGFKCIRIVARIPRLSGNGHGRWSEVLNLFELEVEMLGDDSQLGHISLRTPWMAGDEIGDDLLVEMLLAIDAVEDALEFVELLERGLAHQVQHAIAGVFRGHLQTSADMLRNQFAGIVHSRFVRLLVLALIE